MYEPWVMTTAIPDTSIHPAQDPDRPLNPLSQNREPSKQERTGLFVYLLIQQINLCIRDRFAIYSGDDSIDRELSIPSLRRRLIGY
jgi:hypothetical protein